MIGWAVKGKGRKRKRGSGESNTEGGGRAEGESARGQRENRWGWDGFGGGGGNSAARCSGHRQREKERERECETYLTGSRVTDTNDRGDSVRTTWGVLWRGREVEKGPGSRWICGQGGGGGGGREGRRTWEQDQETTRMGLDLGADKESSARSGGEE
ncbi:hypothetical protein BO70DRAFT_86694 [Aspergillus heteromorphus CBS 117.55]|uniref:Uncharacterized protein n=1 Tax=Aspergillus heteromorphus CBS 117.55 TaxID=1448321 RepID=A0A317WYS8_9EURO|nr:uncharacterized protein BO70DRAFT_86694 [Aspergillus heteromorphus CBS 117.55]PWY91155.1 hypothetical protein BO70DRAFT_86694 [Aspergillus heteromorphus CBS 117.55]